MNNYPFFRYVPGDSKFHKLNSKMKILLFIICVLTSVIIKDYISLLIFGMFLLYMILKTKVIFKAYFENIFLLWPIYVIVFVISFALTINIFSSILFLIKMIYIITLFLILTFTTSLSEIAWGFECLFEGLKKVKIPVSKISLTIAMSIKFISNLFEQYRQIKKSMAYKGFRVNSSGFTGKKKIIIPTIRLSYRLSKTTLAAMKLRFYGNLKRRTNYHNNKKTGYDKFLIFISVVVLYICFYIGYIG